MMFSIAKHTIFLTLAGSQAHGTAREGSDVDVRGVCVAPLSQRISLFSSVEQHEGPLEDELAALALPKLQAHPTASRGLHIKTESVVFDIAKFLGLCATANPNTLEILFADPRDWLLDTPLWQRIYQERHRFLTTQVQQTFLGYAMAQLKKIKSHRAWLLHPPTQKPRREDFGLPHTGSTLSRDDQNRIEQSLAEKLRSDGIEGLEMPKHTRIALQEILNTWHKDVLSTSDDELADRLRAVASHALQIPSEVMSALNAEKKYRAAMKHWDSYQAWLAERNHSRAELERLHGYDTKHAMHLIRLMRMGLEILRDGELHVRRHDAAELNAIRDGAFSFDQLLTMAEQLRSEMESAAQKTSLPSGINRAAIDALFYEIIRES